MKTFLKRTWAEINLDALTANTEEVKKLAAGKQIIGVIKANAYGHGDIQIGKQLNKLGINFFSASNIWEAQRIHDGGVDGNIIIFGYCEISDVLENLEKGFVFTVGDTEYACKLGEAAVKAGVTIPVHIKIDTGMSRVGVCDYESAKAIFETKGLDCKAVYSHFAVADSDAPDDINYTDMQQKKVQEISQKLGLPFHSQNSGGILYHDGYEGDFVRAGIILYGQKPSTDLEIPSCFKPIMELKTVVSQLKYIDSETSISYGRTFKSDKKMRVALLPVGYADGLHRRLSNSWSVLINGKPAKICGRVCMDQTIVDVTDIDVKAGDEVTVFSATKKGYTIDDMADYLGTINYELLCNIAMRVPRVYISGGKVVDVCRYV